jgi:predicted metalloprotease
MAGRATRRWVVALVVCVVAAGCGGDDTPTAVKRGDLESPAVARMPAAPAGGAAGELAAPESLASKGFLRAAFDSAESLWRQKFDAAGMQYQPARLTFFHAAVNTACGHQTAQTGPFYCPPSHGVYLNTDFFDALGRTFGLSSPFAPGYVTAHEVAHHVQQLLGLHGRVAAADAQDPGGANGRSVRVELQADCYAGIWLHYVARAGQLSEADVEDILRAAAVVGDDFQRNKAGVELAPETWTHGCPRSGSTGSASARTPAGLPTATPSASAGSPTRSTAPLPRTGRGRSGRRRRRARCGGWRA